jgi:hypothetical protein
MFCKTDLGTRFGLGERGLSSYSSGHWIGGYAGVCWFTELGFVIKQTTDNRLVRPGGVCGAKSRMVALKGITYESLTDRSADCRTEEEA